MGQVVINQTTNVLPISGVNAVQLLTIGGTPTAGGIQFSFNGRVSTSAVWSATTATLLAHINTALTGLFGAGNVVASEDSLSSGIGTVYLTFGGTYASAPQPLIVAVNGLTGTAPTAAITSNTLGVIATFRQAAPGALLTYLNGGAADEVQTLTIGGSPSSGTFTISGGTAQNPTQILTTGAITWSATSATTVTNIQNALNATFGSGNVTAADSTLSSGVGNVTLTFTGTNATAAMGNVFTANGASLTGGTVAIAETTPGGTGASSIGIYVNTSLAPFQPTWTVSGIIP